MNLSLRKLEIMAAVVEHGGVTRAAEALYLTQSAVSMALSDVERQSGGPLFKRVGRRLVLNERGRILLPEVEALLESARRVERFLECGGHGMVGELRVGASSTVGNYVMPSLLAVFSGANPGVRIRLSVGNTRQMAEALADGGLDLAVVEGPVSVPTLDVALWRADELSVVVAPGHPWMAADCLVGPELLGEARWIVRERGSGTREVFEKAMRQQNIPIGVFMELGHTEAIKKAVEAGLGVGCLSRLTVRRELEHGWLREVRTPLMLGRDLNLLTHSLATESAMVSEFVRFMSANR